MRNSVGDETDAASVCPTSTARLMTMPSMGDRIVVRSRLTLASSTMADAARASARAASELGRRLFGGQHGGFDFHFRDQVPAAELTRPLRLHLRIVGHDLRPLRLAFGLDQAGAACASSLSYIRGVELGDHLPGRDTAR